MSLSAWCVDLDDLRNHLIRTVRRLLLSRDGQGRPRPREIWLTRDQWEAVSDFFEKKGMFATSMSCVVQGVWLRPQGDKIAAKASEPLVVQEI